MDQLQAMRVFVRVAERANFSAVARDLNSTQSQISRQVAALEQRLGAVLLNRTTRQVQLTPEGLAYLEYARRALAEADEGEALLRGGRQALAGRLRLTSSGAVFQHLLFDPLQALMTEHPQLELDINLADGFIDLVTEGMDLAVRAGQLDDSGLVARKLCDLEFVVVASREYLQRHADQRPPIVAPAALSQHECLSFSQWRDPRWFFEADDGQRQAVAVRSRWRLGNGAAIREALLRGLGVAQVPRFLVEELLRDGRLTQLLPGFRSARVPLQAVYPASRRQVARVELVVQALLAHLAAPG